MRMVKILLTVIFVAVALRPAAARAGDDVDLLLVLAADVSRSIDAAKFQLQRDGYAAAISDPRVLDAIRSGHIGRIGLTFVEWSGVGAQHVVIDWTTIGDAASAKDFGDRLLEAPRSFADRTSISGAIDFAMSQFDPSAVRIGPPHHRYFRRRHQQCRPRRHRGARRRRRQRRHHQWARHPQRQPDVVESRSHQSAGRPRQLLSQQRHRRPRCVRHGRAELQLVRPSHHRQVDRRGGAGTPAAKPARLARRIRHRIAAPEKAGFVYARQAIWRSTGR